MNALTNFHFIRPILLLLAPLAVVLWWWLRRQNDPLATWRSVMEPELLNAMTVAPPGRRAPQDLPLLAAWILTVMAISGPTWQQQPSPFADDPVPVMLVLKAGDSMQQSDLSPSRMERARLKALDFTAARKGEPLGLVAYAGSAHLVLPPTRDTDVVATMAGEISPEIMPKPGDDLPSALALAMKTLDAARGSVVVFADTVSPETAPELEKLRSSSSIDFHILAIARPNTPEASDLARAANALRAKLTMLTPDGQDISTVVRQVSSAPRSVSVEGASARWAESGWWLTPLIAILTLLSFRREESAQEVVS